MGSETLTERLQDTLALFDEAGDPLTTPEVAEQLGLGRRTAYARLERLVERDLLDTKKVGASARVWWRPAQTGRVDHENTERTLSRLIRNVPGMVYRCRDEPGWPMSFASAAAADITGYDAAAIETGDVSWGDDVVHPADRHWVRDEIHDQLESNAEFSVTYRICTAEGETRWVRERGCAVVEDGERTGVLEGVVIDVSGEVESKRTASRQEKQFRSLVEATEEYAIFMLDPDGNVQTWNAGAERIKGYEGADIIGEHFSTFYTDEDREAGVPEQNLAAALEEGSTTDVGWRVRKDGTRFWANVTITAIRDDDGELQRFAKVTRDMTDRREYEQKLRQERDFTRRILETTPASIVVLGADGDVVTVNERFRQKMGLAEAESLSVGDLRLYDESGELIPPEERPYRTVFETGEPFFDWRCQVERPSGDRIWASVNVAPVESDDGEVERVVVAAQDITQQREQQKRLERQRDELVAELDEVFDRIDDAFFALDDEWRFTHVNERAATLLDRSAAELVGRNVWEVFPESRDSTFREQYERALETQESVSFEEYSSLLEAWFEVAAYPSDTGLSVYFRDVTDRKARERELERYETIVETIWDGVYALDPNENFVMVNEAFLELTGYDRDELLGKPGKTVHSDEINETAADQARRVALGEQEGAAVEFDLQTADGEAVPVESRFGPYSYDGERYGRTGVVRDITERKRREQELREYQRIVETVDDGIYVLDEERRFRRVNDAFVSMTAFDREELLGAHASVVFGDKFDDLDREANREFAAGEADVAEFEEELYTAEGDTITVENRFTQFAVEDGQGRAGVVRDITERKRYERELEEARNRYRTLVDNFPNGAVALVDEDLTYVTFGGTVEGDSNLTGDDLEGKPVAEAISRQVADVVVPAYEDALAGESSEFEASIDGRDYQFYFAPVRDDDGEVFAALGMSQDITERKEYERHLQDTKDQLEAAAEAGAVGTWEWRVPEDRLVTGASFARTFGIDPEEAREGVSLDRLLSSIHQEDRDRVTRKVEEALDACGEYEAEYRVWNADGEMQWVVARGHVECDGEGNPVTFPGALADITERKQVEMELEQHRQQLAALNHLNEVVQNITSAVIDQSTREEIEETVCERLASSDSYKFAWIAEVDPRTGSIVSRTESGFEGYLDEIDLSIDPDDPAGRGPAGKAVRTKEVQIAHVFDDAEFEPWREHAEAYGFRSTAAIPIVHEGTLYGVLGIYTDRERAFDGEERAVVGQLGEIVGHAIAAAERKQALMSDDLVELEFQLPNVFGALDLPAEPDGRITLDHSVPVGDGRFLVYGTATPEAVDTVERLAEVTPHWESVTIQSGGDPVRFEVLMDDPPVLSVVASLGGYVDEAVVEGGTSRLTIHLTPNVDVRRVIDAVEETYPEAEMLRRQQITRERDGDHQIQRRLATDLTDRQRATLEAAYHAGFFEWPRAASGEDVAESMGVSPPTFHQHLRKAERKVFEELFGAPDRSAA